MESWDKYWAELHVSRKFAPDWANTEASLKIVNCGGK